MFAFKGIFQHTIQLKRPQKGQWFHRKGEAPHQPMPSYIDMWCVWMPRNLTILSRGAHSGYKSARLCSIVHVEGSSRIAPAVSALPGVGFGTRWAELCPRTTDDVAHGWHFALPHFVFHEEHFYLYKYFALSVHFHLYSLLQFHFNLCFLLQLYFDSYLL